MSRPRDFCNQFLNQERRNAARFRAFQRASIVRKLILKSHRIRDLISRAFKWHLSYYGLGRGLPINASLYITEACNCRCLMCNVWKRKNPATCPRVVQERAVDALARLGCYYYTISGGEPTLVKDLPERLAYAAAKIPYVHLVTNGLSMTAELAREIGSAGIREISISLDGTEAEHNTLRGVADAYARAWHAIELCSVHAARAQIVVNSVLTRYNLDGLREIGNRLKKFPRIYQKYLPLSFHALFGNKEQKMPAFPGKEESLGAMEKFLDDARANPRIVNSDVFLRKAKRYFGGAPDIIPEQPHCLYPYHSIEIDAHGFAYPCITGMDFKDGISPETDLEQGLKSSRYRALQKKLKKCASCRGSMMLCYYEPRLNFPLPHLLRGFCANRT